MAFCARALPAGRAFSRRLYIACQRGKKPHHFIRISKDILNDISIWKIFLEYYNGISYILDDEWLSSSVLNLFTDSAGGIGGGCGIYFNGKWSYLPWPMYWKEDVFRDITYLEMIPIALAIYLWGSLWQRKKIMFHSDNQSVVKIINSCSSKSPRVISLVRHIVLRSFLGSFHIKIVHIPGYKNVFADLNSRGKFQKYKELAPCAEPHPTLVPADFWTILDQKC